MTDKKKKWLWFCLVVLPLICSRSADAISKKNVIRILVKQNKLFHNNSVASTVFRSIGWGITKGLTAIDLLIEDESVTEWTKDTLIPCVVRGKDAVKLDLSDENKERYAIITTNKEQRIYTDADRYMEIQEWKKIIQELREKGIDAIPGMEEETINIKGEKTRDILSKTTGMSRGTVNKFEKVTNKGSDALKDALLDGKISVSVAEKATELNEEEQKKLVKKAEKLEQEGKKLQVSDVTVQSTQKVNLSESEWTKDTEDIVAMLQQNDVKLDEQALKKYHFYIKQIKKIVGGRP